MMTFSREAMRLALDDRLLVFARQGHQTRPKSRVAAEEHIALFRKIIRDGIAADDDALILHIALCQALRHRHYFTGDIDNIEEQIWLYEAIILKVSEHLSVRSAAICGLGTALRSRYERFGDVNDLNKAIALHLEAVECSGTQEQQSNLQYTLGELSISLRARFDDLGREEDITDAIQRGQAVLCLRPEGHPHRDYALIHLGWALWRRYTFGGDPKDLHGAIDLNQQALNLRPEGHPERDMSLNDMGIGTRYLFELTGDVDKLHEAERYHRAAFDLRPGGHPWRWASLLNLSLILQTKYSLDGNTGLLDTALVYAQEAVDLSPKGSFYYAWTQDGLANSLLLRFRAGGERQDLEDAIHHARLVVESRPSGNPHRDWSLDSLAGTLLERFKHLGFDDDIDESIQTYQESLQLRQVGHRFHSQALSNLSLALLLRYEHYKRLLDLQDAIRLLEAWLQSAHLAESQRGLRLKHLAHALHLQYKNGVDNAPRIIDRAIKLYEEVLRSVGPHELHDTMLNLANCYQTRFDIHCHLEDSTMALDLLERALARLPLGHADRALCQAALARLFLTRRSPSFDLRKGIEYHLAASTDPHCNARLRLSDSIRTLSIAESGFDEQHPLDSASRKLLLDAYQAVIDLIPRVADVSLDLRARLLVLSNTENLGAYAALHGLNLHKTNTALELLEQGRSTFWRQCIRLRAPFYDLPSKLARRLTEVSRQLEMGASRTGNLPPHLNDRADGIIDQEIAARRRLGEDFEKLVSQAQSIPGNQHFMSRTTFHHLAAAASDGPVVLLMATGPSCHAIILSDPHSDAHHIPLTGLTYAKLVKLQHQTKTANQAFRSIRVNERRRMTHVESSKIGMRMVLAELWTKVMVDIIACLKWEVKSGRQRPRLWICPTGVFCRLPVHAAGLYEHPYPNCCSDFLLASYTPTLEFLLRARRRAPPVLRSDVKILLATVPHPFKWDPLPYAREEACAIAQVVPHDALIGSPDYLSTSAAVRDVLDNFTQTHILHLASHGYQDEANALNTGFVMSDGMLTLSDIVSLNLPNAFLAFLNACETAKGDETRSDQVIHLAAAMLFAGFRTVIGTMWSMGDHDGPVVAKKVYEELLRSEGEHIERYDVPYAIDAAVTLMREGGMHPSLWATYIHGGM